MTPVLQYPGCICCKYPDRHQHVCDCCQHPVFSQADLDAAVQAERAKWLGVTKVTVVAPPTQPWELELQDMLKAQYEMGYRNGRASKP